MRPSRSILRSIALSGLLWLSHTACTPRCQESCSKVLDCDPETTRTARDECVLACQLQESLYDDWEDDVKIKAFREHRRCLRNSTCEEIEAGICYDDELFLFDPPTSAPAASE